MALGWLLVAPDLLLVALDWLLVSAWLLLVVPDGSWLLLIGSRLLLAALMVP